MPGDKLLNNRSSWGFSFSPQQLDQCGGLLTQSASYFGPVGPRAWFLLREAFPFLRVFGLPQVCVCLCLFVCLSGALRAEGSLGLCQTPGFYMAWGTWPWGNVGSCLHGYISCIYGEQRSCLFLFVPVNAVLPLLQPHLPFSPQKTVSRSWY